MKTTSQLSAALQAAFERPAGGVVGLIDELFRLCPEQGLRFDWQDDRCRVRSLGNGSEEVLDRPLPRSVFRAMLARVAALCNERRPGSVSRYAREGQVLAAADPARLFQVTLTNTTEEQTLEVVPAPNKNGS